MSDENWEVVDEVAGDIQAEILRGYLEAQGIPVWLSQEGVGRVYGLGIGVLGNVQILVPTSNYEKARALLDDYYAGKIEGEELDTGEETENQG